MKSAAPRFETNSLAECALIDQLCKREPAALMAVYDRYAVSVYSLVLRITRDQKTSEDLVHELFLRLCDRSSRIDLTRGSLRIWLLCAARKMALHHVPSRSAHRVEDGKRPISEPSSEPMMHRSASVGTAFLTLDSQQRQVLELAYFNGSSQPEMAAFLGQPLDTVKSWIHSALRHVRHNYSASR